MAWIGWQEGMVGTPVQSAKRQLRRKFSYAQHLDDTPAFTAELAEVLREYQTRKNASRRDGEYAVDPLRTDGVLDYATQKALGVLQPDPVEVAPKTVVFTVNGTGVGWDFGYPFDLARWQDQSRVTVQPIGYPAAVFPMESSVEAGEAELVRQMRLHLDPNPAVKFILIGYSQGAVVTSRILKRMRTAGDLNAYLDRCIAGVTFGNPLREAGHFTGATDPGGHGLDPDCLKGTPTWWHDYATEGDIYTCGAGVEGDVMEYMTAIYLAVMGHLLTGRDNLAEQLFELFTNPFGEAPDVMKAIASGWGFVTANPPTAPHIEYHVRECFPGVTHFDHAFRFVRDTVEAGHRLA